MAPKPIPMPLDEIRLWAANGDTLAEMAARLGCSTAPICNAMRRHGIPRNPPKARPQHNYFWRGGRTVDKSGYILVKVWGHPHATKSGYVREHRLVVEKHLGRYLLPTERIHHIDGDPANNELSNLRLYASNGDHLKDELTGNMHLPPSAIETIRQLALQREAAKRLPNQRASETGARAQP